MPRCRHHNLVLIAPNNNKMRCRGCHLTIDEEELADGYCPECYEGYGVKRRDFETLEPEYDGKTRYSCEECGGLVTA